MKVKRLGLIVVLVLILSIGWIVSLRKVSGVDIKKDYKLMLEAADRFNDRELYIRAIPLYMDALALNVSNEEEIDVIQNKLLSAYLQLGDIESYVDLVVERIDANRAVEEEYLKLADYYLMNSKNLDAFNVMKTGMKNLQEHDSLFELYEAHRYENALNHSRWVEICPTIDSTIMPAYDGEAWGYVGKNGKMVVPFEFEEVSMFNSKGFAVVKRDGVYYTINKNNQDWSVNDGKYKDEISEIKGLDGDNVILKYGNRYTIFNVDFKQLVADYSYEDMIPLTSSRRIVFNNGQWKLLDDEWKPIEGAEPFDDIKLNSIGKAFSGGVATVHIDGKWYVIDLDGKKLTDGFVDAKAPESNGFIAVSDENGKWGYINQKGEKVIECEYYDAYSFSDSLGAVKLFNDEWVYISVYGEKVISDYPLIDAKPFHSGVAVVKTVEGAGILSLKFKEY